jgi:hypothetical protein
VVRLDPLEERGVVAELPILLRVGTFGDCKEGGSLHSIQLLIQHAGGVVQHGLDGVGPGPDFVGRE